MGPFFILGGETMAVNDWIRKILMVGRSGNSVEVDNDGNINTGLSNSKIVQPVDIQARLTQSIQTHTGVTIPNNNGVSTGIGWVDSHVDGSPLTHLGITASMTSGTGMRIEVQFSNDGVNYFSFISVYDGTTKDFATDKDIQLSARWFRISITNKDASAPKVTNAHAYLKA